MVIGADNAQRKRLAVLEMLKSADKNRDEILQKFIRLASELLGIPRSFISILDDERQYIRVSHNFPQIETSLNDAFCRHILAADEMVVCCDTLNDDRFCRSPFTLGEPGIRFYAGAPLRTASGTVVGTFCLTDTQPHAFSSENIETLELLAGLVTGYLQAWYKTGYIDVVTMLPNRQRLLRDIELLAESDNDLPHQLVLIDCIDMPRAYEMARTLGMPAVEALLRDIAMLLRLRLRLKQEDVLYTVATGRFALLLTENHPLSGSSISCKLEGIRAQITYDIAVSLDVFSGMVRFTPVGCDISETLRQAVSALHEAISTKQAFLEYNASVDSTHSDDFLLINDIAAALQGDGGLYLVYQPKVNLQSGKTVGLEALIRWRHPVHGELPPDRFIPLVEKTSVMADLTDWVIDRALHQLNLWKQKGINIPVSVNVTVSDFSRPGFADMLEAKMLRMGLQPDELGIECLETEKVLESEAALNGLDMLKLRGFRISLDDFGAGYSNISYLRRIPMDVIKLDRSLIKQVSSDNASRIIARSVIKLLKDLDYIVLAEGVEGLETANSLHAWGCDEAQGFYYSRPLPPAQLEGWLMWQQRDDSL
ncbi:EAL domain-containing protein [Erwinia sp. V71]|uniref:sensor domain-containing diguanylate cyclase n=1 Tax=Erwinia sp. V71 TaxID=3369424 RepID=UPI003F603975